MSEAARAEKYERLHPGASSDESQRAERWERLAFKEERQTGRRTGRNRGVVIPDLPWKREDER